MRVLRVLALAGIVAGLLAAFTLTGSASAASPEQECMAAGGTFIKSPPDNQCVFPGDPPGMNQGGVVKDETATSDRGKSGPHETTTTCQVINNGGSHNCTTS